MGSKFLLQCKQFSLSIIISWFIFIRYGFGWGLGWKYPVENWENFCALSWKNYIGIDVYSLMEENGWLFYEVGLILFVLVSNWVIMVRFFSINRVCEKRDLWKLLSITKFSPRKNQTPGKPHPSEYVRPIRPILMEKGYVNCIPWNFYPDEKNRGESNHSAVDLAQFKIRFERE